MTKKTKKRKPIDNFLETVARLRSPKGCPWDKVQTHKTLKRYLIEEAYEAIDAIDKNDSEHLMEELGDVLLQVALHAQIAKENKKFSFDDIVNHINKKMISRHPHVFSDTVLKTPEDVMVNWEIIKKQEKSQRKDIFDGVPNSLPALLKALKISKKVVKEGFEWEHEKDLWRAFEKEIQEFKKAIKSNDKIDQTEELGDLLFMVVNLARWYKIEPEDTLNMAIKKFINRYKKVKQKLASQNKEVKELSSSKLNKIWKTIKKEEKK